jgi:hypothetical protein
LNQLIKTAIFNFRPGFNKELQLAAVIVNSYEFVWQDEIFSDIMIA